jgi:hypothetical protein
VLTTIPFFASLGINAWLKRGSLEKLISSTNVKKIDRLFIVMIPFVPPYPPNNIPERRIKGYK